MSTATFLDRVILSIVPRRGLDRIEARLRASALMNYDAAGRGRRTSKWLAPATDADAASNAGRARLRQLSRDMVRNAPFARRAQSVVTNNVVGAGIIPAIVAVDPAARVLAEVQILGHLKSLGLDVHGLHNIYGLQTVVMNSVFESGEVLILRRMRRTANGLGLPFQVEVLEVDHLNPTIMTAGVNEVRDGIEYDSYGRVVAYHLYQQHPGTASRKLTLKTDRIRASEILHIRRIERPGQVRGVPWLAPVMLTLGEMRDYQEAQILKQKISALLTGVVEVGEGESMPAGGSGLDGMAPGAFVYTEPGQKVTFTDPPRVDDYDAVMRLGLSAVAMGLGLTYEGLSGDLSRVNFSSMRAGRLETDANVVAWQSRVMVEQLCDGIGRWCLDANRLIDGARGISLTWTPPVRPMVDPIKEIPAVIKKIEAGLSSLQREQRKLGLDPGTILRERIEDAADQKALQPPAPPGATPPKPT